MNKSHLDPKRSLPVLMTLYVVYGLAQASEEYRVLFLEGQGLSAAECGQVLAAASLLAAFSRPLAGALADKLRSRRAVYVGAALGWLALLALLLLTRHVRLASFALCAGVVPFVSASCQITYGMLEAGGVNAALQIPKLDYSLIRLCLSIGYSVINFLYTPIVKRFGSMAPFFCTMAFLVLLLAFSGGLRPFEATRIPGRAKASGGQRLRLARLFKNYYLIAFVLLSFILSCGTYTAPYTVYLLDTLGMDTSLVGIMSGVRVLGEILIMPLVPYIKRRISLPMLQAVAAALSGTQLAVFLLCRNPYVILGTTVLQGLSAGITLSTTAVYLRLMAPEGLETTTLSLSTATSLLGGVVMSLMGGALVDSLGVYALYRTALCCLGVWLVLYFGTWSLGKYVLKKEPPAPMLLKKVPIPTGSKGELPRR